MEKTIYTIADLIIPALIVVGCLYFLVSGMSATDAETGEVKTGIYGVLGTVPTKEEADDNVHITPDAVEGTATAGAAVATYNNIILKTWSTVSMKGLFSITTNGNTYDGTQEFVGGFKIVLEDVTDEEGTSVLTRAATDITDEMENMTISVLYNTTDETLTFYESGTFKIRIRIKDSNGKSTYTTIGVPVENTFNF